MVPTEKECDWWTTPNVRLSYHSCSCILTVTLMRVCRPRLGLILVSLHGYKTATVTKAIVLVMQVLDLHPKIFLNGLSLIFIFTL